MPLAFAYVSLVDGFAWILHGCYWWTSYFATPASAGSSMVFVTRRPTLKPQEHEQSLQEVVNMAKPASSLKFNRLFKESQT